jgi:hypothetical protein
MSTSSSSPSAGGRSLRSRRLRTAERRRRRRRTQLAVAGIVTLVGLLAGTVVVRDVLVVRAGLTTVRAELSALGGAVAARDVPSAIRVTSVASGALFPAEERVATLRWRTLAAVPRLGAPFALVAELTTSVRAGLDVVEELATEEILAALRPTVVAGSVDLVPLVRLSEALAAAPIDRLSGSLARLEAADTTLAPAVLLAARSEAIDLLQPALTTLIRARDVTGGLPTLLGADGPRRHLVVLQTSAELRGTGGLVGVLVVLDADQGRLALGAPRSFDPLPSTVSDTEAASDDPGASALDPVLQTLPAGARPPLEQRYRARYEHVDPNGSLSNVNVDPDLPTTGEVLLDLYEARTGVRLDGLVLLDPIGLGALLEALDVTLMLPPDLIQGTGAPQRIAPDGFAEYVLVGLYDDFGEQQTAARSAVTSALAGQALDALLGRSWDGAGMADAIVRAASGRHLQVYSRDVVTSRALSSLPVAGRFADDLARPGIDTFAVTVNNAVGGKQDVHVEHATDITIRLGDPGSAGPVRGALDRGGRSMRLREVDRSATIRTTIANPLVPGAFDLYVTGNCLVGTDTNGCFLGQEADHRAWLTFWLGESDVPRLVRDVDGFPPVRLGYFHGVTTIDRHLEVPSASQRWLEVATTGVADLELLDDGSVRYRLGWWRQSKGIADRLSLRIEAPEGWVFVSAGLADGGRPLPLLGPDRSLPALSVNRTSEVVEVVGVTGGDVELEVVLRPR